MGYGLNTVLFRPKDISGGQRTIVVMTDGKIAKESGHFNKNSFTF